MAKRKRECNLDDIVMEYLKRAKCEKTSKLFGIERSGKSDHSKSLEKFIIFLKQKEMKKKYHVEDDLGFEINFGAFQPETKVSYRPQMDRITWQNQNFHKPNDGPKKETEKRKIDVPKEFIKKIGNLGMKVEDVEVLFRSKIDWTAVYSENKIYCIEPGCDYFTKIDNDELTNHMIDVHKYGDYPCNYDHCNYVATSKVLVNIGYLGYINKLSLTVIFRKG